MHVYEFLGHSNYHHHIQIQADQTFVMDNVRLLHKDVYKKFKIICQQFQM
jgi:hypothetical protein